MFKAFEFFYGIVWYYMYSINALQYLASCVNNNIFLKKLGHILIKKIIKLDILNTHSNSAMK